MADSSWKERVGIPINYRSDDEEFDPKQNGRERNRLSVPEPEIASSVESSHFMDDSLAEFDQYGATPPRTRILRRQRERRQRDKQHSGSPKIIRAGQPKLNRRNTVDNAYFNDLMQKADANNSDPDTQSRRAEKRSLKILRGSERDLKLDIDIPRPGVSLKMGVQDDRSESMPVMTPQPIQTTLIETCNRFMSLTSRPVVCKWRQKLQYKECIPVQAVETEQYPNDRVEYYQKISNLIRMGCNDKILARQVSQDNVWQNELQDLIWLELQAHHADRTPTQQDTYLCYERENVDQLLQDIMNYKFWRRHGVLPATKGSSTTQSDDSGVVGDSLSITGSNAESTHDLTTCHGCLSMYCPPCMNDQSHALLEVEQLLDRLEAAEALYPSSKAFAHHYPLYKSTIFVGRVKAMCLWYNLMKDQRLKLIILGKLIMSLQGHCRWPLAYLNDTSSTSGINTDLTSSEETSGVPNSMSRSTSVEHGEGPVHPRYRSVVQFDVDCSSSPSDSNNSTASSATESQNRTAGTDEDQYNGHNIFSMPLRKPAEISAEGSPYRKYVEDVLKTKGLRKALQFLEILHQSVLRKAQITLEKPPSNMTFEQFCKHKSDLTKNENNYNIDETELRRYGFWSPEAQGINLPSYRSAFLFLSLVPLEVIHEFMRMRLEQKCNRPSFLSIRQLMRELKEGLRIAVLHRQRILIHINTAVMEQDPEYLHYHDIVKSFDESVKGVLEMYMDYLDQWSSMIQRETFQKSMLEDEWFFVKDICPHIPGSRGFVGEKFCYLVGSMLVNIGKTLKSRVEDLATSIHTGIAAEDHSDERNSMLLVCRALQGVFNEERERSVKAIAFTKTLRKELRSDEFTTDPEIRTRVNEALVELRSDVIGLRKQLSEVIERVLETCDIPSTTEDLDENERAHLVSRCREILHQAFKFGFDIYMQHHISIGQSASEGMAPLEKARLHISRGMIYFAKQWILFVTTRCERGRGQRPRWATQGLEFLSTVCEPQYTKHLSANEFEEFRQQIDNCLIHIVGEASTPSPEILKSTSRLGRTFPRSRGTSPQPRSRKSSVTQRNSITMLRKDSSDRHIHSDEVDASDSISKGSPLFERSQINLVVPLEHHMTPLRKDRVRDAVNRLEKSLDEKLRSDDLIGNITATHYADRVHIKSRVVTFSWQRGIMIGQGRFGKVYTAVNTHTGEMLAMKEISLQPNDHKMIKRVAEEIKTFEGIHHKHLVRYYGVEIHREDMLIFMEFCAEGTLESLGAAIDGGLPEALIRRYTCQLLSAVATLHEHSVAHRDIKSANIFLTDGGNCLKLGDFGSAAKIKAHTTMPGELQGFVGTQAYMAPEVFMRTNTEGHGRAADIWSVGCVIIEMGTGKRPWPQYDSNYQIIFVVGMGETPEYPERLSEEGKDFLDKCLQHDPRDRASAQELRQHNFVKVDDLYLN